MDAPRRPARDDHRGWGVSHVDEELAALCECPHRWVGLGGLTGYLACSRCGQAIYMVMEFEYLTWVKEPLEGHV
jgi:hypothetical protein